MVDEMLKKRHEIQQGHIVEMKKYNVESNIAGYTDLFKSRKNLSTKEQEIKEKLERRDVLLFNFAVKIRTDFFQKFGSNTHFLLSEFANSFYLFQNNNIELSQCFQDLVKMTNMKLEKIREGGIMLNG